MIERAGRDTGKTVSKGVRLIFIALVVGMLAFVVGCGCSRQSNSSTSESSIQVPNLVGLTQTAAQKSITDAGFTVGTITLQNSDTVTSGNVISQSPAALTTAQGGTVINLVVSSGRAATKQVTIPSLVGLTQTQAEAALQAVGLVPMAGDPEANNTVAAGVVFKQNPSAGSTALVGSTVTFTVALGATTVTVPDVTGESQDDATADLTNAGLGVDTTTAYSDTVDAGLIISTDPSAGVSVKSGTKVTMCVSLGSKPASQVAVPNLMTLTLTEAQASLTSAGLTWNVAGDLNGTVISQDPAAGTMVDQGTAVTIVLAGAPNQVAVPDLAGLTLSEAQTSLQNLSLYCAYSGDENGVVATQDPASGTMVNENTTVNIVLGRMS